MRLHATRACFVTTAVLLSMCSTAVAATARKPCHVQSELTLGTDHPLGVSVALEDSGLDVELALGALSTGAHGEVELADRAARVGRAGLIVAARVCAPVGCDLIVARFSLASPGRPPRLVARRRLGRVPASAQILGVRAATVTHATHHDLIVQWRVAGVVSLRLLHVQGLTPLSAALPSSVAGLPVRYSLAPACGLRRVLISNFGDGRATRRLLTFP